MTLATIVAIIIFLFFMIWEGRVFKQNSIVYKLEEDLEEVMTNLLHLVKSNQRNDFTYFIAYYGSDKTRHGEHSLLPEIKEEHNKSKRYFDVINNAIVELQKLSKETIAHSITILNDYDVKVNNLNVYQVELSNGKQKGENSRVLTYRFDFIKGEANYLLLDINGLGLYK